jgi:DNA-binding PadR family transcriptional regulator
MSPRKTARLTLEHTLLALLDQKPMHGYELYQELCGLKGISLIWNIKQSLLYAILEKLESKGYLSSHVVPGDAYPPRKYFHLTDWGRTSLREWLTTPVRRARDFRQEFLAKLIVARSYGEQNALDLLHIQELACETWFVDLSATIQPPNRENMDEWLVYSYRIQRLEGILKWLKACRDEFDQSIQRPSGNTGDLENGKTVF